MLFCMLIASEKFAENQTFLTLSILKTKPGLFQNFHN